VEIADEGEDLVGRRLDVGFTLDAEGVRSRGGQTEHDNDGDHDDDRDDLEHGMHSP
jgi:hypothetical protein